MSETEKIFYLCNLLEIVHYIHYILNSNRIRHRQSCFHFLIFLNQNINRIVVNIIKSSIWWILHKLGAYDQMIETGYFTEVIQEKEKTFIVLLQHFYLSDE